MLDGTTPLELIGWTRIAVLILCFGGAAWLDHKTRRVSNDWWWSWAKPTIFLLCLELLVLEADWMVWLTASAALSFASTALIGRPDLGDLLRGSRIDIAVTIWYLASAVGLGMGAFVHGPVLVDYFSVDAGLLLDPEAERMALLWGQMLLIGVVLLFFEMAWRFRMLHGGADAKAMMLAALLIPSWNGAPVPLLVDVHFTAMPPALSLMIWAGLAFLVLPFIMFIRNLKAGDAFPLEMSWHAFRMPLAEIPNNHVWLLEEMVDRPDGTRGVMRRMRPLRGSRAETDVAAVIDELAAEGCEKAWVTAKYPFLLFVFPAILPFILLGDPITWALEQFSLLA
ncbi:MAG: hypothetical protein QGF94_00585 [Candidatus Thalassarchaeaceae archaeon]|jgi:hypothetical protein|nr:hypothetical protein [Candidatus Thalassarchaeaceae archaeon]